MLHCPLLERGEREGEGRRDREERGRREKEREKERESESSFPFPTKTYIVDGGFLRPLRGIKKEGEIEREQNLKIGQKQQHSNNNIIRQTTTTKDRNCDFDNSNKVSALHTATT